MHTEQANLIGRMANIPGQEYIFSLEEENFGCILINAFRRVIPTIRRLAKRIVKSDRSKLNQFLLFNQTIRQYLSRGVVPSTVVIRNRTYFPTPIAVINAAFLFYLQGLPGLLDRRSSMTIRRRSELQAKLEMWIMKALEDHRLLTGQRVHT
jgi:hypothetical protein